MARRLMWKRVRVGAGVLLALALTGLSAWLLASRWRPSLDAFPVQGIDVSDADGAIDWWKAHEDGVGFAYVRASMGAIDRDARFEANWAGLYETSIPHGAIHQFSLCHLAADQAGNFVATVTRPARALPPALALDFHTDCAARPARDVVIGEIERFLAGIEPHFGQRALIRVTPEFEARYRVSEAIDRRYWSVSAFFPPDYLAKPWSVWQASHYRRISAAKGAVNWNVMAR